MHTYNKNGARIAKVQNDKKVKKGIKEFYTRLGQIEEICKYLRTLKEPVTEENIDSIVPELIGRELDSMERFLILGKLYNPDEQEDNVK
jgi:hypothetical protein